MAIALAHRRSLGHTTVQACLLSAQEETNLGTWVDLSGVYIVTVDVSGIITATVELRGSNTPTRPDDAFEEILIQDVTQDTLIVVPFPVRWIKACVTAYTSGTIYAYLYGNQPS